VKESEDSHQIKHWLTSHEELLAPPGFRFKIIQTFQDPLSRQLAEAVRIDLRGENILNSKAEYSHCRVPRLRINMEGWKEKVKEKEGACISSSLETSAESCSLLEEQARQDVEENLEDLELKRKSDTQADQVVRKPERLRMERLEGWGIGTTHVKDL
jgi:hypothetical protein